MLKFAVLSGLLLFAGQSLASPLSVPLHLALASANAEAELTGIRFTEISLEQAKKEAKKFDQKMMIKVYASW